MSRRHGEVESRRKDILLFVYLAIIICSIDGDKNGGDSTGCICDQ